MAREVLNEEAFPLFETKQAKGGAAFKLLAFSIFVCICLIWAYRILFLPGVGEQGRWIWIGMFLAEIGFGLYWACTQAIRWNVTRRYPFKERLLRRYRDKLPGVDIFVCTADPVLEPPILVMNTVLSLMAYTHPAEKLNVYLSDDGGSDLTFYALLEASHFSKHWIPFCKRHNIQQRSPEAYFAGGHNGQDTTFAQEWLIVKQLYEDMRNKIESISHKGIIPRDIRDQHKGFLEWNHKVTKRDHQSIVQIIIDGRHATAVDKDGSRLPTLVYIAREKRPQYHHNFKAGAMNALIRVSSEISNAPIILNLDCDMKANDPDAIMDALCFFLDDEKGHEIGFLQHPQTFSNITKNDIYAGSGLVVHKVELTGMDGYDAALYCGTGCFHRRESLTGQKYSKVYQERLNNNEARSSNLERTTGELEEEAKVFISCEYEKETPWGKEMGLVYGCPVEDVVTGMTIQCRGWKSVYYYPDREAFKGVAPSTLDVALIQQKRWCEGLSQIFFSKYCPFIYAHGKLSLGAQMGYSVYLLWAPLSLHTVYYVIVPPLCLIRGIPLFPQVSSLWFAPFAYAFMARSIYSIFEALKSGYTLRGWWNLQRMTVIRRTTAYFFACIDLVIKLVGLSHTAFAVTAKVMTEDVLERYEQEIMEFGTSSIMFILLAAVAILNLFALLGAMIKRVMLDMNSKPDQTLTLQVVYCLLLVVLHLPVYQALFLRHDKGRLPSSVLFKSIILVSFACLVPII
ncbi:hypothetical protein K2173_010423 [Erythroxylum novogranatense]|uniref:Cellulose synthase-like protein E6 n=1 Tax=Erythroxylum novogranatense TaxID=1862640 RepID=A0AAV8TFX6_9ROSI|nr:hypothetical protein K2173_010423 [Erythroxylum novogranatense]